MVEKELTLFMVMIR